MTKPIRMVVVDDMALARERALRYLAEEADIVVVGEAASGAEAVRLISREGPDLALLDVELPDFDGFEVLRRLPAELRPLAIYVTAHDDRALQAFDVSALDYLTKPFDRERLDRALNRARHQLRLHSGTDESPREFLKRLAVSEKGRTDLLNTSEIDYIDVAGHYLCIHVGRSVHLVRGQLGDLEEKLDPREFARIHRSAMVRIDRVRSLAARRNGDCDVILSDGSRLLLSRTYAESLRARLGLQDS